MRPLHVALVGLLATGCRFDVSGIDAGRVADLHVAPDGGIQDFDLGTDLPVFFAPDLAHDLGQAIDFAAIDLSTRAIDLSIADLTPSVPNFPSHVGFHYLSDSSADWNVVANTRIDTHALTISTPTPGGLVLVNDGGLAVLAVHTMTLGSATASNVTIDVVGDRPLVIVAGASIEVWGFIDAGGHANAPGPAGNGPATGGGQGASAVAARAGGGGAGYGTVGGAGGAAMTPIAAGATYGDGTLTTLAGGSGGGTGAMAGATVSSGCTNPAPGGSGGGALQLSSRSIIVHANGSGELGTLSVAGGGGRGGCASSSNGGGGAGGGSGGSLLVEAPALTLSGRLDAAGGGGGGGAETLGFGTPPSQLDGNTGYDGLVVGSEGFSSRGGLGLASGGAGYNNFESLTPAAAGGFTGGGFFHDGGGGGGGGAGRIYVRTSKAITPTATPAAVVDTSLPATIP